MTVDGPEIGTLVVIVDRAKNLPNRKTIGKQNPYCAARLGKEAKKTETDHRGGQTPRWYVVEFNYNAANWTNSDPRDQELRFTVHDSPDYFQLKVSVFNDDKRTDLIGETWISLQEVVVPGGGQSDTWHNLSCKGKYAGEVRVEITYYDTRPKQERPEKAKHGGAATSVEDGGREALKGPRQPKAPVKRRPLPSDPITGAPPPNAIPDHVQTPPRGYKSPAGTPEHVQPPPRGYEQSMNGQEYTQTPPRAQPQQSMNGQEYTQTPPRAQPHQPNSVPEHVQTPSRVPPVAIPQHIQTPPRGYQSPAYISNQSPLQNVEYGKPTSQYSVGGYDRSSTLDGYGSHKVIPHEERNELYEPVTPRNDYAPAHSSKGYGSHHGHYEEEEEHIDHRDTYNRHTPYEIPPPDEYGSPPSPGGPPPPPPAHGSRHGSNHVSPQPLMRPQENYAFPTPARASTWDASPSKEAHRNSLSSYSQPKPYMAYITSKNDDPYGKESTGPHQEAEPRHHSYDARYNTDYGSMQPTVEDAPPSPSGHYSGHRGSASRSPGDRRYDEVPSPAPLNLSGRGSVASGRNSISTPPSHQAAHQYSISNGYNSSNSQISIRNRSQTGTSLSSRTSYNTIPQQNQIPRKPSRNQLAELEPDYGLPAVPPTLVAGMDPMIAQEIQERIYDERRKSFSSQGPSLVSQGSYQELPHYHQPQHEFEPYPEDAMVPYAPSAAQSSYDERKSRYSNTTGTVVHKPRGVSPDPRVPARKSVSPSPAPPEENRRLSGIPFGPDSYNALNPKISGSASTPSLSARYDPQEPNLDAKIITHDGREIDPSDHIPESNYAPLLESKGPKYASQMPDRNYRPPPTSSQASSGRKQLKVVARPVSMATPPSGPAVYMGTGPNDPLSNTGRNRLQKKSNRMSAMPAPHSSPLAPMTAYQSNSHTPRSVPRPNTATYDSNANYNPSPNYGGSYRENAGPPPIPAKVPMRMDSGPPPPQSSGADAWTLLDEMKNIDLGSGRSRRRGHY
jgi:hypothetical protein